MFKSRIFWKLYGTLVLVILFASATVWIVASRRIEKQVLRQVKANLTARAYLLEEQLGPVFPGDRSPDLQARVRRLGQRIHTRITLIRADGLVLADSERDVVGMESHARRPEVLESARTRAPAAAIREMSRSVGVGMLYLAVPVLADGEVIGYVRTSLELSELEARRRFLQSNVLLGAGVSAVLALLAGLFIFQGLARPLARMTRVARAIADGDYSRRLPTGTRDEFGWLAESLLAMERQLEDRMNALTRERNELRAILASMLEGVVAVDGDERIVHMNEIAGRFLQVSASESSGKPIWEVTRVEDVCRTITEVLADVSEHTREVRITRGRQERDLELRASPLKGGEGEVLGAVLVLHDVTELRRLETVRRDFVANVSHELKTPLTAIRGYLETLRDDEDAAPEIQKRFLARAADQVLRLSSLVADLLVLSRVESEAQALERRPMDLRPPIAESARRLAPDVRGRQLELVTDLPDREVPILGDEEALRHVADNLLDNAIKYTPDGGRIELRLAVESGYAVLTVKDTGIGIDARDVSRIFERFYRVDKARSRELGGTGLGLSIVKHIVEAHAGQVSVTSSPGHGSTFQVEVPLRGSAVED